MEANYRSAQTPIGVYYCTQDFSEAPAYFIPLADARQAKKEKRSYFVNHGKDVCLIGQREPDHSEMLAGGTMRDSWQIKESGHIPVWQMRPIRCAT